jgi:hypothetical protein
MRMAAAICDAIWRWTDQGSLPIVIDAASCTNGLLDDVKNYLDDARRAQLDQMTILDSIAWCHDLMPALKISHRVKTVAVHPTMNAIRVRGQRPGSRKRWLSVPTPAPEQLQEELEHVECVQEDRCGDKRC